jgi:hypothetical protein
VEVRAQVDKAFNMLEALAGSLNEYHAKVMEVNRILTVLAAATDKE